MNLKRLIALILIAGVATTSYSQEKNKTYLYFADAFNLVKAQNMTIKIDKYEHQSLLFQKKAMSGLRYPEFTLSANYTLLSKNVEMDLNSIKGSIGDIANTFPDSFKPIFQPAIDKIMGMDLMMKIQDNNFGVFGVGMVMPIYMGGKINAANNVAKIKIEANDNKKEKNIAALCSELSERYFGLSLARQVSFVRKEVVAGMKTHYDNAVLLEKNGIIAKGEKLYAEMFWDKAKADEQKSLRNIISINSALENTLNAQAVYFPLTNLFILTSIEPVDFFVQNALDNSPQLKEVGFNKRIAKEQVRAKRAEILPHISAIGAANIVDYQLTDVIPRAMIGVSINYKLFNGAKNIYEFKSSKETVKMVEMYEEKARMDITTLIEKSYNDILSLGEQVDSYRSTIAFSQEYLRVKEKAFNEGIASSSDVVDAQLNLAKAKIERMELAYKYDVAFAKLLEICGLSDRYQFYMVGATSKQISF